MHPKCPNAAKLYRKQIALGLDGDPRAALTAHVILRKLHPGNVRLVPDADGGLWAEYDLAPGRYC